MEGSNPNHRISACSHLFDHLLTKLEGEIFVSDKSCHMMSQHIRNAQEELDSARKETAQLHTTLSTKLAAQESILSALDAENKQLLSTNGDLREQLLSRDGQLQRASEALQAAQRSMLAMHLQSLHLAAQTRAACDDVSRAVKSKMGFVPTHVAHSLRLLGTLKPVDEELWETGGEDSKDAAPRPERPPTPSRGKSQSLLRPVPVLVPRSYQQDNKKNSNGSISCEGKDTLLRILNDASSDKENRFVFS
mmetsp:Transcript_8985/g.13382  ORF Transcript_8985/g.13382 Transcript_8985/m.13382 type:complete len:249 (+) Transcript_8985:408-1154(+)